VANDIAVDESANGSAVDLATGQELTIRLPENRLAGYRWMLDDAGEPACVCLGDTHEAPSQALGGQGAHEWRFQAVRGGEGTIALAYRRPWEQGQPAARTFTLRVRVNPA
jgi:inhibitor of cysteine peptidase